MAKRHGRREAKPAAPAALPAKRPLSEPERAELLAWGKRMNRQPRAPRFKSDGKGALTWADGTDPDLHFARVAAAVGTGDGQAINLLICQAAETVERDGLETKYNTAAALSAGIQPRNEVEGMLAVQMVGCHNLAMAMLRRATKTDRVDWLATYGSLAAKLLRTFTMQTEALARLRGQTGQQTVRVEHVTLRPAGRRWSAP